MESWSLAVVAGALLAGAAVSRRLNTSAVTPAMLFTAVGLVTGSEVLGWIDLTPDESQVGVLAEATLTLVLFADASRIELANLRRELTLPARLLGIGLPLTIALGAALALPLFRGLGAVEAIVLAIVLAPTDAALGQAVVTDTRLPSRIRQGLNVESGLNDGICVPLLFIALAVADADIGGISKSDAIRLVGEEIGFGILGGLIAGALGAIVIRSSIRRRSAEPSWLQIVPVASAALAYGLAAPLGGSGFIAAFVGGLVFGALRRRVGGDVSYLLQQGGDVLNAVTFVVFGAVILGPALTAVTWEAILYAVLSLTVVRMPPVAIALLGMRARAPTTLYLGWFGPRGLASIVFGVIVVEQADLPSKQPVLLATAMTIGISIYAHGLSARSLTDRYARWFASQPVQPEMESVRVHEHRWRTSPRRAAA